MTWGEFAKLAVMATIPVLILLFSMYYGMVISGDGFHVTEAW